jgi:hypothetical protein
MFKELSMRKTLTWMGSGLLLAALLAHAGEDKAQTFRGEIADTQCALNIHSLTRSHTEMLKSKRMGGTAAACATYCVQYLGGDFVLSSKTEVYRLDSQQKVRLFAGQKVKLSGTLDSKSKTIHVVDIEASQ